MKRRLLGPLAIVSVLIAILLLPGYLGEFGPAIDYTSIAGGAPFQRNLNLTIDEGRARLTLMTVTPPPATPTGWRLVWIHRYLPISGTSIGHWLSWFRIRIGPFPNGMFGILCPVWFLELLCLIAPYIWLRARRRPNPRGFPVIQPDRRPAWPVNKW